MNTSIKEFKRTLRGLKTDKLEFIFSIDRLCRDDDNILIVGKNENYLTNSVIREKLLDIYDICPKRMKI